MNESCIDAGDTVDLKACGTCRLQTDLCANERIEIVESTTSCPEGEELCVGLEINCTCNHDACHGKGVVIVLDDYSCKVCWISGAVNDTLADPKVIEVIFAISVRIVIIIKIGFTIQHVQLLVVFENDWFIVAIQGGVVAREHVLVHRGGSRFDCVRVPTSEDVSISDSYAVELVLIVASKIYVTCLFETILLGRVHKAGRVNGIKDLRVGKDA